MPPRNRRASSLPASAPIGRLALALARRADPKRPLIHVATSARRAQALVETARALCPEVAIAHFPGWDCFPYDRMPPSKACMGARMGVLRWLTDAENRPGLVITTPAALVRRVPPRSVWAFAHHDIRVGDAFEADTLEAALVRIGYRLDDRVDEPGEAAFRPHVLDLFPAAAPLPCRVEHEDGRVVAVRSYDPATQTGAADTAHLVVDPASEIVRPPDAPAEPLAYGAEHRLAERYDTLETLFAYCPDARLTLEEEADGLVADALEEVRDACETARAMREAREGARPPLPPEALHLTLAEWREARDARKPEIVAAGTGKEAGVPRFVVQERPRPAFARFVAERRKSGERVLLAADAELLAPFLRRARGALKESPTRVADFAEAARAKTGALCALAAPLEAGFVDEETGVVVIAAADLLGETGIARRRGARLGEDATLPAIGDVVVHAEHGLGRLDGLERIGAGAQEDDAPREAARLVYADGATLLVPADELDRVWRHGGSGDAVKLDRLDTDSWAKRRADVEAAIAKAAADLQRLAAARREATAPALHASERDLARFAARFPFALTPDQASAVSAVLADMARTTPMDRLVCGDVGYGKTEVALRAAAVAAFAGKQVALVAPTTVLARQHADTLHRRFAGFGVPVAQLSRLVPEAEAKRVRAGLADGSVRIVVGTHALAVEGMRFSDLGLVVVDEEQRFGAEDKEALHALGEGAHVLTLTATPIPATLAGSLIGLRDLSTIATPPVARKPVRTALAAWDHSVVREALARERARDGQSFVVLPRIADIDGVRARIAALLPDLRLAVAHGRMKPAAIDDAMLDFACGDDPPDVLIATNIIESGLDVPRANTMLIVRPDRFGLAQLHQLRGRVGRGPRQAACWLLTEADTQLAEDTRARLDALVANDRLGAGFALSLRDLDLRGAGDLLGDAQAGHAAEIGIELYRDLLDRALAAARGEREASAIAPRVEIGLHGAIPEDVVASPDMRLELYARLARLQDEEALDALAEEVEDRFGAPGEAMEDALALARLRLACRRLGILRLEAGPAAVAATFVEDAANAVRERTEPPLAWRGNRLVFPRESESPHERLALAQALVEALDAASCARREPGCGRAVRPAPFNRSSCPWRTRRLSRTCSSTPSRTSITARSRRCAPIRASSRPSTTTISSRRSRRIARRRRARSSGSTRSSRCSASPPAARPARRCRG